MARHHTGIGERCEAEGLCLRASCGDHGGLALEGLEQGDAGGKVGWGRGFEEGDTLGSVVDVEAGPREVVVGSGHRVGFGGYAAADEVVELDEGFG